MLADLENFTARFSDFVVYGILGDLQVVFVASVVSSVSTVLGTPPAAGSPYSPPA